jgi:hypothetical protein
VKAKKRESFLFISQIFNLSSIFSDHFDFPLFALIQAKKESNFYLIKSFNGIFLWHLFADCGELGSQEIAVLLC